MKSNVKGDTKNETQRIRDKEVSRKLGKGESNTNWRTEDEIQETKEAIKAQKRAKRKSDKGSAN